MALRRQDAAPFSPRSRQLGHYPGAIGGRPLRPPTSAAASRLQTRDRVMQFAIGERLPWHADLRRGYEVSVTAFPSGPCFVDLHKDLIRVDILRRPLPTSTSIGSSPTSTTVSMRVRTGGNALRTSARNCERCTVMATDSQLRGLAISVFAGVGAMHEYATLRGRCGSKSQTNRCHAEDRSAEFGGSRSSEPCVASARYPGTFVGAVRWRCI